MFAEQLGRVLVTAQCRFEPMMEFGTRVPSALKSIWKKSEFPNWQITGGKGLLRDPAGGTILLADHRSIQFQSTSGNCLKSHLSDVMELFRAFLDNLRILECESVRLETRWYPEIGMSHSEITDLAIKAFSMPSDLQSFVCGETTDYLCHFHGDLHDFKCITQLYCMSAQNVVESLNAWVNLDHFREDDKYDTKLNQLKTRLAYDTFGIITDVSKMQLSAAEIASSFRTAVSVVEQISDNALRLLKAIEPQRLKWQ